MFNWNTKTTRLISKIFDRYFYWLISLLASIGFNGYPNPMQTRVFGDVYPVKYADYTEVYKYFGPIEFQTSRTAFYRYFLDEARYYILGMGANPNLVQWLFIFLPLLLTTAGTIIFFRSLSGSKFTSLILWSLWNFTTFNLYTSSIHTHILIAINLMLIWLGLYYWAGMRRLKFLQRIAYIASSSLLLILAFNYDLRIIILTLPGLLAEFFSGTKKYRSQ